MCGRTVNPCELGSIPSCGAKYTLTMNSKDVGTLGEHIAIIELLKNDVIVSRPLGDNSRYDLVLDIGGTLYTCQVKSTNSASDELAEFFLQSSQAHRGGTRSSYTVDVFCLVDIPKQAVFLYMNTDNRTKLSLRYIDTGSRQLRASTQCTWAKDYTLERVLSQMR